MEQAAIIFFRSDAVNLNALYDLLVTLDCSVERAEWSLGAALGMSDSEMEENKARDILRRFSISSFDPGSEQSKVLLRAITARINGVLWDNINGVVWAADCC